MVERLRSPGIRITTTDESFYASADVGTVPLFVIATASNKRHPAGTSIAEGTLTSGLYLAESQRDLLERYGNPNFYKPRQTVIQGHILNEYGLHAAHAYLGSNSLAYVLRVGVNLNELDGTSTPPAGLPQEGDLWVDLNESKFTIYDYASSAWSTTAKNILRPVGADVGNNGQPVDGYGENTANLVAITTVDTERSDGTKFSTLIFWKRDTNAPESPWSSITAANFQFTTDAAPPSGGTSGNFYMRLTGGSKGTNIVVKQYQNGAWVTVFNGVPKKPDDLIAEVEPANRSPIGTPVALYESRDPTTSKAELQVGIWDGSLENKWQASRDIVGDIGSFTTGDFVINGVDIELTIVANTPANQKLGEIVAKINELSETNSDIENIVATSQGNRLVITDTTGRDFAISGVTASHLGKLGFVETTYSNWVRQKFGGSRVPPAGVSVNGQNWYDNDITSIELRTINPADHTWNTANATTFTIEGETARPTAAAGNEGHFHVDLSSGEPKIQKSQDDGSSGYEWVDLDNSNPEQVVFGDIYDPADSTEGTGPAGKTYLNPKKVDASAVAFNTYKSGGVVRKYNAESKRWEIASGFKPNGVPYFGIEAQKNAIVNAMRTAILNNEDLRQDTTRFRLMAAPGFPEVTGALIELNEKYRDETAFIVTETPMDMAPNAANIVQWTADNIPNNRNVAVYYPAGRARNVTGEQVVVPASSFVLRTYAANDENAFEWFAPAGYNRGGVPDDIDAVGWINADGVFEPTALYKEQRDILYDGRVNPITRFPNSGLLIFGQKTTQLRQSAFDRVNVSRLMVYLRTEFADAMQPFYFEPNDAQTRRQASSVINDILNGVQSNRGLEDYLVVCDQTNNTPARIDRNELWIDVAVLPTKAVEFIYIPVRVSNAQNGLGGEEESEAETEA